VHLACRDKNRSQIEHALLARRRRVKISTRSVGGYPSTEGSRKAKPVFDIGPSMSFVWQDP
jgi:hypothetical protein